MPLIIEHRFPLGRFHATRWNQNPFEDPFGEWPPSPWRLLRALIARWFQFSRETGVADDASRDELLRTLGASLPVFYIPDRTWRGRPELRQYQPYEVGWTDASAKAAAYKKAKTTLVADHYRVLPTDEPIFWCWETDLRPELRLLLRELLRRVLYFGRAESYSSFRVIEDLPQNPGHKCVLTSSRTGGVPVLAHNPQQPFNLNVLLAATDDKLVADRRIPPGTAWYYAVLPRPQVVRPTYHRPSPPEGHRVVQFAVGGRVFPPATHFLRVTDRFRGRVLREFFWRISGGRTAEYVKLRPEERARASLLLGKDAVGQPTNTHDHAYFCLYPDENDQPTRLICWREKPFSSGELAAILKAADQPIPWDFAAPDWRVRLIPLPFTTQMPPALDSRTSATVWTSRTPFVPPSNRYRFRKSGRLRPGESASVLLKKLLVRAGYPEPHVESVSNQRDCEWVHVHQHRQERIQRKHERTTTTLPGYYFRLKFPQAVNGPICVGHSCHFGLGLFGPAGE
jgi:CRISPR-associated protein Csb2